ncbi:MAG TPA: hypothetical protein VLF20_01890 [Patescibacteria group bacterium]|nr:hypothetical protein [Patescibacteria group bacterium]
MPQTAKTKQKKQQRAQQWQQKQQQTWQEQDDLAKMYSNDVHTYLSWEAPGRPFKERSRQFFINASFLMFVILLILFLFSQYVLMGVVLALVFLAFALASVPPRTFQYKISSQGILIEKSFFIWEELYDFYFYKHHGVETVHITTKTLFPGELTLTLGEDVTEHDIKSVLLHYLPFREYVEPTWIEKAGDWLDRTFPLERAPK